MLLLDRALVMQDERVKLSRLVKASERNGTTLMDNDPLIGQQLGAYQIQAKLGEGGMARVYKAYHGRLRREVAIKVILSHIANEADFQARFEREAQLIASLQHPNIVAVYDFGELENLTYLVMQYVGGGTLRDQLRAGYPLDPRLATKYTLQMARALHHAHLRGIVHRDVKPQNMLVSASDSSQLLLSDFGIAKLFDSHPEATLPPHGAQTSNPALTSIDQIVGTAEYIAPEQAQGKPVDARTDVYALGVVLYQMLTGRVPFHSTTIQGLLFQHVYDDPKPVYEINPYAPEILAQIAARAMMKAPEERFQSAEAMAQALEVAMAYATNPLSASSSNKLGTQGAPNDYRASPSQGAGTPPPNYQLPSYSSTPGPATPLTNSPYRVTHPSGPITPPFPRRTGKLGIRYIAITLLILLALTALVTRFHPLALPGSDALPQQTTTISPSIAQPFTEGFQHNDRNWPVGNTGHLTAIIDASKYTLTLDNVKETSFPNPAAVGALPTNFTLTVQIMQTQGSTNIYYGLAFRLRQDVSKVYCYAFVINGMGSYAVLKYDPQSANGYTQLWEGTSKAIKGGLNQGNTLQATIRGGSFSFLINGQPAPVQLNNADTQAYIGGQLALLVAGPDTGFEVSSVKLTVP